MYPSESFLNLKPNGMSKNQFELKVHILTDTKQAIAKVWLSNFVSISEVTNIMHWVLPNKK